MTERKSDSRARSLARMHSNRRMRIFWDCTIASECTAVRWSERNIDHTESGVGAGGPQSTLVVFSLVVFSKGKSAERQLWVEHGRERGEGESKRRRIGEN